MRRYTIMSATLVQSAEELGYHPSGGNTKQNSTTGVQVVSSVSCSKGHGQCLLKVGIGLSCTKAFCPVSPDQIWGNVCCACGE
jgi:hypothetical protein